jgi:hypothetical protein
MSYDVNELERILVRLYVEKALFEKGTVIYDSVCGYLCQNYRCYLEDCYEHPEYLITALKDIPGNDIGDIVSSIKNDLKEFYRYNKIARFLNVLSNMDLDN